jgi:hypothetical protein
MIFDRPSQARVVAWYHTGLWKHGNPSILHYHCDWELGQRHLVVIDRPSWWIRFGQLGSHSEESIKIRMMIEHYSSALYVALCSSSQASHALTCSLRVLTCL